MINTKQTNNKQKTSDNWQGSLYLTDNFSKYETLEEVKSSSQLLSEFYKNSSNQDDAKRAKRMDECCSALLLRADKNKEWKAHCHHHCRVRYCPICEANRSKKCQAIFYQNIDEVMNKYPKSRWLFLTLTAKNCHVNDLRATLRRMNKAFTRLNGYAALKKSVLGFVKVVEFTRPENDPMKVHPHFHVLLLVKGSYFRGQSYISKSKWIELWRKAMRINYTPIIDIKAINTTTDDDLERNKRLLSYVFKYSTKPNETLRLDSNNKNDIKWFSELVKQTHKMRFISKGGVLKEVLKPRKREDEDDKALDILRLQFNWERQERRYCFHDLFTRHHLKTLNKERREKIKELESQVSTSPNLISLMEELKDRVRKTEAQLAMT